MNAFLINFRAFDTRRETLDAYRDRDTVRRPALRATPCLLPYVLRRA